MEKVTIIIPNYNGQALLSKNLPTVIKRCPNSEIIIVDDASSDKSVSLIHKKFKKVKVVRLKKNYGFANAVNQGITKARTRLVLLLNSDVSPRKNFLNPAFFYFKDKNTFSVGFEDQSHEKGKVVPRGRSGANFKRGFIEHFPASPERGTTFWTSGGSSLVNREKYLELKGFDTIYKPFYWEDIDLCFRAWRKGYKCYYEPLSKVDHYHESGSISKNSRKFYIKSISYKNQFLFVWKNIDNYYLIALHIMWIPYHILKSALRLDMAFFYGLMLAILTLPKLISTVNFPAYSFTTRQIINKFSNEKQ